MGDPDLIIYGGAFDPPHQGHIDCVRVAAERFPTSQIWIVPAAQPAGASGQHKSTTLSFEHRLRLCELAFGPLMSSHPSITISTIERDLPPPNFTIRTLTWAKAKSGYKTFALLLGQDQLAAFDRWRAPEEILQTSAIIAVSRKSPAPGKSDEDPRSVASALLKSLGQVPQWSEHDQSWLVPGTTIKITMIEKELSDANSTALRDQLEGSGNIREDWLPEPVLEYIKSHKLFREPRP